MKLKHKKGNTLGEDLKAVPVISAITKTNLELTTTFTKKYVHIYIYQRSQINNQTNHPPTTLSRFFEPKYLADVTVGTSLRGGRLYGCSLQSFLCWVYHGLPKVFCIDHHLNRQVLPFASATSKFPGLIWLLQYIGIWVRYCNLDKHMCKHAAFWSILHTVNQ